VILLQLYRLYVVYSENRKSLANKRKMRNYSHEKSSKGRGNKKRRDCEDVYVICNEKEKRNKKR
jgi:hypothetical protein